MHRLKPYDLQQRPRFSSKRQAYIREHLASIAVDISKYELVETVGQGAFGIVSKARERNNRCHLVALKMIKMENGNDFPLTSLREIRLLNALRHRNIVNFIELCISNRAAGPAYFIAMEYCDFDLEKLLRVDLVLKLVEIKRIMLDMLNGLYFMHFSNVVHRDLKPHNILINAKGVVKLADFGSARILFTPEQAMLRKPLTRLVVTLWYRAPELLLGDRNYGRAVDVWSVGCIFAQMWSRTTLLQGCSEQEQLQLIIELCGSINPTTWPNVDRLKLYRALNLGQFVSERRVRSHLWELVKSEEACDLLDKLLTLDPKSRIDVDTALNHEFFWNNPLPGNLHRMLVQFKQKCSSSLTSKPANGSGRDQSKQLFDQIF